MTKQELFKNYHIDESHSEWNESIDNWVSIEIFRIMHGGRLPTSEDVSLQYILDFIDKKDADFKWWLKNVMSRNDWGSLYLTSKRLVYKFSEQLLIIKNQKNG